MVVVSWVERERCKPPPPHTGVERCNPPLTHRVEEDLLDTRGPLEIKELMGLLDPRERLEREADLVSMGDREFLEISDMMGQKEQLGTRGRTD